jgi:uncharacterized protein YgbK (DUF1537 family)
MLLGAIADDLTGATDLALMLSREGMRTVQIVGVPEGAIDAGDVDAVVVSLKSRTIPAADAVAQSLVAARALLAAGASQLFFKYCSTFDSNDAGNIGPVIEALLDLVGARVTIACPAFPANGRTVYQGHLFVGPLLLSDSPMKDHPLTPMRDANLVRVLSRQTRLPVGLVPFKTVAAGVQTVRRCFDGAEGVLIVDALSDTDLRAIGAAASDLSLVTGGSGVAIGLPANFRANGLLPAVTPDEAFTAPPGRTLVLAGSCSATTRRQIEIAKAGGFHTLKVDALDLARGRIDADCIVRYVEEGEDIALVYSSAEPSHVAEVQEALGKERSGSLVESLLADVAKRLAERGFTRFIVAGGETSGAVVEALGVEAMRIGVEIDPGVPWMRARGSGRDLALALKSGNFGGDDFFQRAVSLVR